MKQDYDNKRGQTGDEQLPCRTRTFIRRRNADSSSRVVCYHSLTERGNERGAEKDLFADSAAVAKI